jgi:hypothetical protein
VDRATGDWWIADVGQGSWEEINHEPTGQRGNSYGWKRYEGDQLFSSITAPTPSSQSTRPPMPAELGISASAIVQFGVDAAGEVYVVSLNGPVYRMLPN